MKNRFLFATMLAIFVLVTLLIQASVDAQVQIGCCCNPITLNGTFESLTTCQEKGYIFVRPPATLAETCADVCNATLAPQINVTPPEVVVPERVDCDSPAYKPPLTDVAVRSVKGLPVLVVSYSLPCPAFSVNISRCQGRGCDDFELVAQVSPAGTYTDNDPSLLWNTEYTYRLVADYRVSGPSAPVTVTGGLGDLECWNQGNDLFCISPSYYERFKGYLVNNGYGSSSGRDFEADFESAVLEEFAERMNKAWRCSDENLLNAGADQVACSSDQVCVADEQGARCVEVEPCYQGDVFGLYSSIASCEGSEPEKKYCFFDRSRTSVDSCFACSPGMTCADYRSKGACERDNCNAGACEWRDVLADIGIGVCVDTRVQNCASCKSRGAFGMDNNDSYNEVFDQCTQSKAGALSIDGYPCIFDKNRYEAVGCDSAACMDFEALSCGSPAGGIMLNADNSLASRSSDVCNIGVCQVIGDVGCVKNADGDDVPDCDVLGSDRRDCELDYFPPNTTLVPRSDAPGRMDWLVVRMLDKFNFTHPGSLMFGQPGYGLNVCVVSEETSCSSSDDFKGVGEAVLNFNDLRLQSGKDLLFWMNPGENTLKFYSVDNHSNLEVVKEMVVTACDKCQGPKVLQVLVEPGRLVEGTHYTFAKLPAIRVFFNEPASLVSSALFFGDAGIPLATTASSDKYEYTFVPVRELQDGSYVLSFTVRDDNKVENIGSVSLVVDTTPGRVTILPPDGTILEKNEVNVSFIFEEPSNILGAVIEEEVWIDKYATRKKLIDLLELLETRDDITFEASVDNLLDGKKNIKVEAEDFAGNPTIGVSSFWVARGKLLQRLREPSWGVSSTFTFDVVIDTSLPADCRYVYNVPAPPPLTQFEFLNKFTENNKVTHVIRGFNKIPVGDLNSHKLHVYCKGEKESSLVTYELRVDPSAPRILKAYADPEVIIERRVPWANIFTTTLKVETDDFGFCKYSTKNVPFVSMNGLFKGYDEVPTKSHVVEVNVTSDNESYTYYVACKNTAELPSPTVPVGFSVDLSKNFSAKSLTPQYFNTTTVTLRVVTNKRAFCYYGETSEVGLMNLMGEGLYGTAHSQILNVNSSGNYKWYVSCSTGASDEVAALEIPVTVDNTPPYMLYVNDDSVLVNDTNYSYFLDRLLVSFLGEDDESEVNRYYYRVFEFESDNEITNWTLSTNTNGTPFYITGLNLTDGNKYGVEVYPVNVLGLAGEPLKSDGVTIDVEKQPTNCSNGQKDSGETGIDCGGSCPSCDIGVGCLSDVDCDSGLCRNATCLISGCSDNVKNGNETDVDCGGSCAPCSVGKHCGQNSDCAGGSCVGGICTAEVDACADGELSGTESDVDCGGVCNGCGEGKKCQTRADCASGLSCSLEGVCISEIDSDDDGVLDRIDECPNTPRGEPVDEKGCSESQRYSCGDEINDGWRTRYFDSVLCDGDGAGNADPDGDGLTNLEEFSNNTNPKSKDTDMDGWSDKEELDSGTNPLDPDDHPQSKWRFVLWLLLILLLLAGIGVGGYVAYKYYQEKKRPVPPIVPGAPVRPVPRAPVRRVVPIPGAIERLKPLARRAPAKPVVEKEWVPLEEVTARLKKKPEAAKPSEDAFARLRKLKAELVKKAEVAKPGVVKKPVAGKPEEAFEKLKKLVRERRKK